MHLGKSFISAIAAVLPLWHVVTARSATGERILVVIEHDVNRERYSGFWQSLQQRGFELTFKGPKEETHPLVRYGEKQFDHLIMMAPSASAFAKDLSPQSLLSNTLESHINTLFISSPTQSDSLTTFYREFDLEFSKKGLGLVSHDPELSIHNTIGFQLSAGLDNQVPATVVSKHTKSLTKPFYYQGSVHTPGHINPFLIPVLHAPSGTFSSPLSSASAREGTFEDEEDELSSMKGTKKKLTKVMTGKEAGLISVFQSRGNVRFGWLGGMAMLEDSVWTAKTSNPELVSDVASWVFQETGVLKVISTEHYRMKEVPAVDHSSEAEFAKESKDRFTGYTVKEEVTYEMTLAQFDSTSNNSIGSSAWIPVHIDDLQLDFTMLDPHVRTSIDFAGDIRDGSLYSKTFRVPDRHGVFKFMVDWWRPGYTYIHESTTTSVIPFRHDEYPRFIRGAYPFYSGAFIVSGSFLLFCIIWLHLDVTDGKLGKAGNGKKDK